MRDPEPIQIEPDAWCAWCGDPLPEKEERHWRRRFCCQSCKAAHKYDRAKEARRAALPVKSCEWCGTTFKAKRAFQIYCKTQCRWDAKNAAARKG